MPCLPGCLGICNGRGGSVPWNWEAANSGWPLPQCWPPRGLPAPFAHCSGLSGFCARAWLQPGLVVWVCLLQRTRYNELPLMEVLLHAVKEICLPIAPVLPPIPTFWEPLQGIHNLGLASCSRGEHPELTAKIH